RAAGRLNGRAGEEVLIASQKNSFYSLPSIAGLGNCKPAAPPFFERGFCESSADCSKTALADRACDPDRWHRRRKCSTNSSASWARSLARQRTSANNSEQQRTHARNR